jgi:pilus biogenesis lipoprotein CpaD
MSSNDRRFNREPSLMRAPLIASLAFVALCAGASAAAADPASGHAAPISTEQFGIQVKPSPLELMIAAHASGLSLPQTDALRDFTWRWINEDRAPITVSAPEHGPDAAGVYRTASEARDFLIEQGVPSAAIQIVGYDAAGDAHAPIRVSFEHLIAEGPQCGQSWSNLSDTHQNQTYPEFGCSITANIATQVADAADFLHPRTSEPPDAVRRENAINTYRTPGITGTPQDAQANASLSSVGQ